MSRINEVTDEEALRPVVAPQTIKIEAAARRGDFYSRLVFLLSALLALAAMAASAIGFAGFAENDTGIIHLITAFLLCFGLGALAYIPLLIIAVYAHTAIWKPMSRGRALIVICLLLPWFPFGFYLSKTGELPRNLALMTGISALFILGWAIRFLRRS